MFAAGLLKQVKMAFQGISWGRQEGLSCQTAAFLGCKSFLTAWPVLMLAIVKIA